VPSIRDKDGEAGSAAAAMRTVEVRDYPICIGPYRITRPLGEGGMGVVYLAEQMEPVRREVALKVLKMGLDTKQVVARFQSERQALAVMEHPNITKVYDAGATEAGAPYFVMERVDGAPITDYSDAHHLSIRERVRLFLQVCRAVEHAHQKGIIHRDLKPSNVLVTEADGAPLCKVIDFGIAKATERPADAVQVTLAEQLVGTPAYMSPEQTAGTSLDVDTRSDVYSLGVLLYELLAGVLPYGPDAYHGWALKAHRLATDPPPPSARLVTVESETQTSLSALRRTVPTSLRRQLRGELDWVILKALDKDRERRYQTANALALDLERYLADEPVLAGPPSPAYRARKFVRRHRWAVAFASTTLVLLMGVTVAVMVQAQRIARARAVAELRQGQAEELIGFVLGDLRTRLTPIGRLDILDEVGRKATEYFAAVPEAELSDTELFRRSQALRQLGEVRVDQGKLADGMNAFRESLELANGLAVRDPTNGEWQVGLGASHFWTGYILWRQADPDGALEHFLPYLRITEALVARHPDSLAYRLEQAYALSNIGSVKETKGDLRGALAAFNSTLAIKQDLVRRDSTNPERQLDLAQTHNSIGVVQRKLGNLREAATSHRSELAIKQSLVARDPTNRQWARGLAIAHAFLGDLLINLGDVRGALREMQLARAIHGSLAAYDTSNAEQRWRLANSERLVGQTLLERGDVRTALRELHSGRSRMEQLLAGSPDNVEWQQELARTQVALGQALTRDGRLAEARAALRDALGIAEPAVAQKPDDLNLRRLLSETYIGWGAVLARTGDAAGARRAWTHSYEMIDSVARQSGHTDLLARAATALLHLNRVDEATPLLRELLRRGYRRPGLLDLAREKGAVPMQ
jgi:serine/threonine protein kinase